MNEFYSETGGRYLYTDDIENLQALALAHEELYRGCGDFVISGCAITSNGTSYSVSAGFVYLDGKVRTVAAISGVTTDRYLAPDNVSENVQYYDNVTKKGRNLYKTKWINTQPASGAFIRFGSNVTVRTIKDALFGRYSLLKDFDVNQSISSPVTFQQLVAMVGGMNIGSTGKYSIGAESGKLELRYQENRQSVLFSLSQNGVEVFVNGNKVGQFDGNGLTSTETIVANIIKSGKYSITEGGIMEISSDSAADLWINQFGFNQGNTQYRSLKVGDGKGHALLEIKGDANNPQVLFKNVQGNALFTFGLGATPSVTITPNVTFEGEVFVKGQNIENRYVKPSGLSNYALKTDVSTEIANRAIEDVKYISSVGQYTGRFCKTGKIVSVSLSVVFPNTTNISISSLPSEWLPSSGAINGVAVMASYANGGTPEYGFVGLEYQPSPATLHIAANPSDLVPYYPTVLNFNFMYNIQ